MTERLAIARLGGAGDGIADAPDGPVFVAGALPGEIVQVGRTGPRGSLVAVEQASPERAEPFCPYFGRCGGCVAQHMGPGLYAAWKSARLAQARIEEPVVPLVDAHGEGRRRVTFHGRIEDGAVRVGFMARGSHDLVDVQSCPVTSPDLRGAAKAAHDLAGVLRRSRKPLDIQVTATESGLDIDLRGHGPASPNLMQALIGAAGELDLARLSLHGDVLIERRAPLVPMGRALVRVPPGGFLQATRAGEETLSALVVEGVGGAKRVADLFAGCGPLSLRLAERAVVHAVDSEAGALAALDTAARATPGLRGITTEARDLFRRPLLPLELDRYDAVVLDPPRAGAEAQSRQLAASKVPIVVMVSCDPGTFARDTALLRAAGYVPGPVTPVDQFKYSAHVELVGTFRRPTQRKRRR